jgi:flavin reductase (DIM6/NTAB) family NADH-FMN oxidoreductase RutF
MSITPAKPLPIAKNPAELAEQLRLAMRRQAASVCVVTGVDAGYQRHAITVTSITSLSMNPPALLVCINQWASIYEPLMAGQGFCVNILAADQQLIADNCSRGGRSDDQFSAGIWLSGPGGLPYLQGAQATLFCENDKSICYATHTIFIGRVHHVLLHGEVAPLIYLNGGYLQA